MISRRQYQIALVAVVVLGGVAAVIVWIARPPQVTVSMSPLRALSTQACAAEAHGYGYSLDVADDMCTAGAGSGWYHAVLVNNGSYSQVNCSATAYDVEGNVVFHGVLPFAFGGIRGLFAGHGTTTFNWFLPSPTPAPVSRYVATCSLVPYP
ncbi:MAG TPA: hypothetical protein VGH27_26590 [Streptosporangiaceae bacterium]|jgi:hypothetical protein